MGATPLQAVLVPPPPPIQSGYHTHQRPKTRSSDSIPIYSSPSRPMSPGEQFNEIRVKEMWSQTVAGNPTDEDIRVRYVISDTL